MQLIQDFMTHGKAHYMQPMQYSCFIILGIFDLMQSYSTAGNTPIIQGIISQYLVLIHNTYVPIQNTLHQK